MLFFSFRLRLGDGVHSFWSPAPGLLGLPQHPAETISPILEKFSPILRIPFRPGLDCDPIDQLIFHQLNWLGFSTISRAESKLSIDGTTFSKPESMAFFKDLRVFALTLQEGLQNIFFAVE